MKLLLTGFEPFHNHAKNPSQYIVETIAARTPLEGAKIITQILPVVYGKAGDILRRLIHQHHPDVVLMLGVAGSRERVCLERVALNLNDSKTPDNAGVVLEGEPIDPSGPDAYFGNFPLKDLQAAIEVSDIPVQISNHAGAYLCNNVFYTAAREHVQTGVPARYGFIHVPRAAEFSEDGKGMPLESMVRAVEICIQQLVTAAVPS